MFIVSMTSALKGRWVNDEERRSRQTGISHDEIIIKGFLFLFSLLFRLPSSE